MGRQFETLSSGREVRVCVSPIAEAWEIWVCETGRVALAARVDMDDFIQGLRQGKDLIEIEALSIKAQLEEGVFPLPTNAPFTPCPSS